MRNSVASAARVIRFVTWALALGLIILTVDGTPTDADPLERKEEKRLRGKRQPAVRFEWLGPDKIAGRIRSVLIHPSNANIVYAGSATGGVWKSTNGGQSWSSLDDFMPTLVIGSLAMDPQDPNTIYAGTGEIFTRQAEGLTLRGEDRGQGIFVSRDAGATWHALAFTQTTTDDWRFVSRIAIDASASNHIFAATNTGLWRSTNGGRSFGRVQTDIFLDVKFHPKNPRNVVASSLGGLTRFSTDSGSTWTASIFPAGPDPTRTRVELAAVPTAGQWRAILLSPGMTNNIVLLGSVDGGAHFEFAAAGGPPISCRTDNKGNNRIYTGALWVDPRDSSKMLVGGVQLCRVTIANGVQTVAAVAVPGASDFHAIVEHPGFASGADDGILVGHDQGLRRVRSYDAAQPTLESLNNGLRTTQFHSAATNPISGDVIGTAQDTSVLLREGNTWRQPIDKIEDGATAATELNGPNFLYFGLSQGRIFRSVDGGTTTECIAAKSGAPIGESLADNDCGSAPVSPFCGGKTPILLDPNDANRLYVGCGQLWRTSGARAAAASSINWASVKPRDGDFLINAMDVPKGNSRLMWVGTLRVVNGDVVPDGQLWKTTNATADVPAWQRMDTGLPARPVFDVVVEPRDNEKVYVSYSGFARDNVWRTTNGGTSWTNIGAGLPGVPVWSLAVHPTEVGWLYAGTDVGLYTSTDDGATWSATTRGPATVAISDLQWKGTTNLLTVATYGRGVHHFDATPNPERLSPETLAIKTGTFVSGHVENLIASDNKRFVARSTARFLNTIRVELTTRGGFTRVATPAGSDLTFFIEARADASVNQQLELFDFLSNRYVVMQITSLTKGQERNATTTFANGAGRFINLTTREQKARITWTKKVPYGRRFSVQIDAAGWQITRP